MVSNDGIVAVGGFIVSATDAYFKINEFVFYDNRWWFSASTTHLLASYSASGRIIGEIEFINDRNVRVTIVSGDVILVDNLLVTLPEFSSPTLYKRFADDERYRVGILRW